MQLTEARGQFVKVSRRRRVYVLHRVSMLLAEWCLQLYINDILDVCPRYGVTYMGSVDMFRLHLNMF